MAHETQASVSLTFFPHFDVLCDLLLNTPTATWNLFVLYNDQKRKKSDTNACLVPPCRSQVTSKCGKNNKVAHETQASVSLTFFPHFDVLCDLLLNTPTATWNLFVLYNDQKRKKSDTNACLVPLDCSRICASLGIFSVPSATFRLCFFLFFLLYVLLLPTSFLAQSGIMAKTFC